MFDFNTPLTAYLAPPFTLHNVKYDMLEKQLFRHMIRDSLAGADISAWAAAHDVSARFTARLILIATV